MDYDAFLGAVRQQAELDREDAERATGATLESLVERLSPGEARDIRAQLPAELHRWTHPERGPEPFDVEEFVRRVARREEVDLSTATRHAQAVFWALGSALDAEEVEDLAADLPQDFDPFVAQAQRRDVEVVPAEEFLARVAERAGVDVEAARRVTDAALETLAERIAGGEVDDLLSRLPVELHPPLKRGRDRAPAAQHMTVDKFLKRIAEREEAPIDQAVEHGRAVFVTLREAIPDEEFWDVTVQLPNEYSVLVPPT